MSLTYLKELLSDIINFLIGIEFLMVIKLNTYIIITTISIGYISFMIDTTNSAYVNKMYFNNEFNLKHEGIFKNEIEEKIRHIESLELMNYINKGLLKEEIEEKKRDLESLKLINYINYCRNNN